MNLESIKFIAKGIVNGDGALYQNWLQGIDENFLDVGMGQSVSTSENKILGTWGLAPCVAVASTLTDKEGKTHKFLSHDVNNPGTKRTLEKFAEFINGFPNKEEIENLRVMLVSSQTWKEQFYNAKNQGDGCWPKHLFDGLREILQFYKDKNEDFNIEYSQSLFVKIMQNGEIILPNEFLMKNELQGITSDRDKKATIKAQKHVLELQ